MGSAPPGPIFTREVDVRRQPTWVKATVIVAVLAIVALFAVATSSALR